MNSVTITPDHYAQIASAVTRPPVGWRAGQAGMNVLYRLNEKMYCEIVEADLDPFYDDGKVAAFLEYLEARIE